MQQTTAEQHAERLLPYLPRLAVEWLRAYPEATAQRVDGSMVFVDISGFTALSERLARRGRAGAEELTEVLDSIFARLLTRAWELGGGLVKFGGDSLLLLFTDAGHPSRACAAAYDLRAELAQGGSLQTSSGPVTLRMSVGVHSGDFDFFLVGGSHRELVLAGPGATRTVEAEGAADADQILVSAETAALLDPGLLGERAGPGVLLAERPDVPAFVVPTGDVARLPLEECVPVALRRELLSGIREPEHRVVTVGFLHFQGVDQLLMEQGPQPVADAIGALVGSVQGHLAAEEVCFLGSDVYGDGGKLIFTAGAPTTYGNDEERMLRALRGVFDEGLSLSIRAGVNRGHVYAGEVGSGVRRTYTVMGDAVNLAARLMQAAKPGQILTTNSVLERSGASFDVTALPPFRAKGKSRPVQAYAIGAIVGKKRAVSSGRQLPLVGRAAELDRILEAAELSRTGRGQVLQIAGPGGIGKTRLIEEVRSRLQEFRQYWIACEQYEASTAYWPFRLLLRRQLDIPLDADPEEAGRWLEQYVLDAVPELQPWLPLLAMVVDGRVSSTLEVDDLDDAFRPTKLIWVTSELLDHLLGGAVDADVAGEGAVPTALFFEDAYWMDEASRGVLRRLEALAEDRRWLFVLSTRDIDQSLMPEGDPDHAGVLRLSPLEPEEMRKLATAAAELSPRPAHELEALTERAGGSPLFLLELVGAGIAGEVLPDSLEAAITARIDTLDPPDRMALRCAAVLGRPSFPLRLAEEVLPAHAPSISDPGVWDRLGEFVIRDLPDRLRFQHVLIRDAAYEGLAFRRRREIHGAVADWVESQADEPEEQAELLALHALRAERFEQALRYSRVAGVRARSKAATADAAGFYRQALDAARQLGDVPDVEVADLGEALGEVSELAGLYDGASQAYRLVRQLVAHDPVRSADVLRKEGFVCERAGRYTHARLLYRAGFRALESARSSNEAIRVRAKLEVVMAAALMWEGRFRASVWWARRAAARAESAGIPDVLGHAYYTLDSAYTDLGAPESQEYRGRALPIFEELGDLVMQANVLNNLGVNAYYEGRWDEALDFYARSRRAREKAGDLVEAATAACNVAEVLCQQGHPQRAEAMFQEALRVFRGAGYGAGIAWVTGYLGLVAARLGRFDQGRNLLNESREACRRMGMDMLAIEAEVRLAEASLLAKDPVSATRLIATATATAEGRGGAPYIEAMLGRLRVHALAQQDQLDAAVRAADVSVHLAQAADAPYEVALCLDTKARLTALIGRPDPDAERHSAEIFAELGVEAPPRIPLPEVTDVRESHTAAVAVAAPEG